MQTILHDKIYSLSTILKRIYSLVKKKKQNMLLLASMVTWKLTQNCIKSKGQSWEHV